MDFWDLTKLLLRRWYVAVPLLLMTMGFAGWTWFYVTPDYKTVAYVQLIPPTPPTVTAGQQPEQLRNPWLDLGLESLNSAASVITVNAAFLESLGRQGLSDSITIMQGYPNPIAQIEVVGSTKEQTLATADVVTDRYVATVATLQTERSVGKNSMITTYRLDTGESLEETGGKVKRAVIAVGAVGMLMTVALTVGVDAVLNRRQRRGSAPDDRDDAARRRDGAARRRDAPGHIAPGRSGLDRATRSAPPPPRTSVFARSDEHQPAGQPPSAFSIPAYVVPGQEDRDGGRSREARDDATMVDTTMVDTTMVDATMVDGLRLDPLRAGRPRTSRAAGGVGTYGVPTGTARVDDVSSGSTQTDVEEASTPAVSEAAVSESAVNESMVSESMVSESTGGDGEIGAEVGAEAEVRQASEASEASMAPALPVPPDATIVLPLSQAPRRRKDGEDKRR